MSELTAMIDELLCEVWALQNALNAEFEAIKAQDLDELDRIQKLKESALVNLSDGRFERATVLIRNGQGTSLPADMLEKWQQLRQATQISQDSLKRNELVIESKLVVLREALQAIYQTGFPQNVQLYNRSGKLTRDFGC